MKPLYETQNKIKLTKEMLEKAKPNSIVFSGIGLIEHPWFNNATQKEKGGNLEKDSVSVTVKFVIYRGGIVDWCIYHSLDANLEKSDFLNGNNHLLYDFETIKNVGAKLYSEKQIKGLVSCDIELLSLYRY